MADDAIKAAMEASAQALCREAKSCRGDCGDRCAWREPDVDMPACAAAAVAAFLRALPDETPLPVGGTVYLPHVARELFAAAVERAAKEGA